MKKFLLPVLAVTLLAGCAGERWQKPGASGQEFQKAYYDCKERSEVRFPAKHRASVDERLHNPRLMMSRCEPGNSAVICLPVKCDYIWPEITLYCKYPPSLVPLDYKEGMRNADFRVCMAENGWKPAD